MATQAERLERFKALMDHYSMSPTDYDEGEEEDPRPYFAGEQELAQYVCVTTNYSSHGEAKQFFLPTFDTLDAAKARAVEYTTDDIFEELPETIVDLDTGEQWYPERARVTWKQGARHT
jgi:hypothetical protein